MSYRTLGDYFNPGQALAQAEQIKTHQQQRRIQEEMAPYELKMAQLRPQLQEMQLAEGQKRLEQGPISGIMADKTFTTNDALKFLAFGSPEEQKMARNFLDKNLEFERQRISTRYGQLAGDTADFYAEKVLTNPNYITKFSARSPQRAEIANLVQKKANERGLKIPDLTLKNSQMNATVKSYNKQKQTFDADRKIADEFFVDVNRVREQINNVRTNYPSLINASIKKIRTAAATDKAGPEAVLSQELDALLQSYARVTLDTSSSISEMSATAQQRYQKLLNSNSPAFVLFQQLENFETALKDRMKARNTSLLRLESQIGKFSDFSQKKETERKEPAKFTVGNFVVEVE